MVTDAIVVFMTSRDADEARRLAEMLVEKRLAACVQILPEMQSVYRWQGKVDSSREWLLLAKTTQERFPAVRDAIRKLHSYDLPECVAINIEDGSSDYLQWLTDSVQE